MEVEGKIKEIGAEQQVSPTFKKRELVVTTDEQYPQHILIDFIQDKADLLKSYNVGDSVKVLINLRGREWLNPQGQTRYFNSIQGWKIETLDAKSATPTVKQTPKTIAQEQLSFANDDEEVDDLPF